jgi:chromosome segregation ATPase
VDRLQKAIHQLQEQVVGLDKKASLSTTELITQLRALRSRLSMYSRLLKRFSTDLDSSAARFSALEASVDVLSTTDTAILDRLSQHDGAIRSLLVSVSRVESLLSDLSNTTANLSNTTAASETEITALKTLVAELTARVDAEDDTSSQLILHNRAQERKQSFMYVVIVMSFFRDTISERLLIPIAIFVAACARECKRRCRSKSTAVTIWHDQQAMALRGRLSQ